MSASDKAAFGAIYDSGTTKVGGGNVSGTVYVRFNMTSNWGAGAQGDSYGALQLTPGGTGTVEELNAAQGIEVGKVWGHNAFSYMLPAQSAEGDLKLRKSHGWPDLSVSDQGNTSTFVVKVTFNAKRHRCGDALLESHGCPRVEPTKRP